MIAKLAKQTTRAFVVLLMNLSVSAGTAAALEINLVAGEIDKLMPGGVTVPMWGFALDPNFGGDGVVTVPGPPIVVPPGDATLNIHLRNTLAVPVSVIIPGQIAEAVAPVRENGRIKSFTYETAPGATETYTWANFRPGTYLYHSGRHPAVQVQMGLYGRATKDAAVGEAYTGIPYDGEVVLFYSEIDPALHEAVDNGSYGAPPMTSTIDYQPKYFLVNGEPYSAGSLPPHSVGVAGDRVLLRFLNAGLRTHAPVLLGAHVSAVAEDGNAYPYPKEQYSLVLPAGQTKDAVFTAVGGRYPLFDRRLDLTDAGAPSGGMLSLLVVGGCEYDGDGDGTVGPGDFALFPPCWQQCDTDPAWSTYGCGQVDYDDDGCVNAGDFSFFASAWLKPCDDPTIVLP